MYCSLIPSAVLSNPVTPLSILVYHHCQVLPMYCSLIPSAVLSITVTTLSILVYHHCQVLPVYCSLIPNAVLSIPVTPMLILVYHHCRFFLCIVVSFPVLYSPSLLQHCQYWCTTIVRFLLCIVVSFPTRCTLHPCYNTVKTGVPALSSSSYVL